MCVHVCVCVCIIFDFCSISRGFKSPKVILKENLVDFLISCLVLWHINPSGSLNAKSSYIYIYIYIYIICF